MKASSPLSFHGVSSHYSRPILPRSKRESRRLLTTLNPCREYFKELTNFAARILAMLENNLVDHPVFLGLLGIHDVVALDVFFNALHGLAAMLGQQRIDGRAHA